MHLVFVKLHQTLFTDKEVYKITQPILMLLLATVTHNNHILAV
jgi:hypothetical protein